MGYQRETDTSFVGWTRIKMTCNLMDVITLCDYETCPTIKCDNEGYAMIVVESYGESQPINNRIGHRFEPDKNRAIGDAQR